MALVGKGTKSIRKKDLSNQKSIGVGFKKLRFWHKATAGESGIGIFSLVFPAELQPTGRQNPSSFELANANIKFFKNNLTIRSSLRGVLMDGLAYDVASSTRINWVGFTSAQDEIFEVTLDENAKTGVNVVDGRQIIASGILPAGETDINIGTAFEINKNPTANIGAVTLHIDRALQLRNTNNSDSALDKDYYEVDPGGGLGIILRLNAPDLGVDREYVVMSLGVVAEKPNESQLQELEKVQGQIDAMVPTLAALAGVPTTDFQSAGPNNIDLKAFGDQVTENKQDIAFLQQLLDVEVSKHYRYEASIQEVGAPNSALGTSNTRIAVLGTEVLNELPVGVGTVVNNAADGWSFTAAKKCIVHIQYTWDGNGAFSRNAEGAELDAGVFSLPHTKIFGYHSDQAGNDSSVGIVPMEPGDVLRVHSNQASGTGDGQMGMSVIVTEKLGDLI